MVGNTIQTVNSPMYDTYMSTPGNAAKLGAIHSNIQTTKESIPGWDRTYNALARQRTTESALNPLCQPGIAFGELKLDQTWFKLSTSTFMPG